MGALVPVSMARSLSRRSRRLAAGMHQIQFLQQWRLAEQSPHLFDLLIDLYWKWNQTRNARRGRRGISGLLAIKPGGRQLDLCCGGGFYTYYFYSGRAGSITGIDYSAEAITVAKRNFQNRNSTAGRIITFTRPTDCCPSPKGGRI